MTFLFCPKHKWQEVISFTEGLIKEKNYKHSHHLNDKDRKKIAGFFLKEESAYTCLDFLKNCENRDIITDVIAEKMIDENAPIKPAPLIEKSVINHYCDKIDDLFNQCYQNLNQPGFNY